MDKEPILKPIENLDGKVNSGLIESLEKGVFGRLCQLVDEHGVKSENTESKDKEVKYITIDGEVFDSILHEEDVKEFIKTIPPFVSSKIHNRAAVMAILESYLRQPASNMDDLVNAYVNPLKCMNKIIHVKEDEDLNKITVCLKTV